MKHLFTAVMLLLLVNSCLAQIRPPSREIINDFAASFYYKYKYQRNEALHSCAYLAGENLGYSPIQTELAVEELDRNVVFREALYQIIFKLYRDDEQILCLNLISVGMNAGNAKKLSQYIIAKNRKGLEEKPPKLMVTGAPLNLSKCLLPPSAIFNCTYERLIDSLNRNQIEYSKDSAIADEVFIGFNIKTLKGEYFIMDDFSIGSYKYEVPAALQSVTKYYLDRGAKIKGKETYYYVMYYKGYLIEIMKIADHVTNVTYNKM